MSDKGNLKVTLPSDREVMITREFTASCAMVFDALTNPDQVRHWYTPKGWSLDVCEIDLKVGGKWRFVLKRPEGKNVGQYGVYQEIVPGERLVNTELWEDWNAGETLVTSTLAEENGKTLFTSTILFPSQEVRDTVLKSGFDSGVSDLYDSLEQHLITQRK